MLEYPYVNKKYHLSLSLSIFWLLIEIRLLRFQESSHLTFQTLKLYTNSKYSNVKHPHSQPSLSIQQHAQNRTWTFFSRRTSISPSSANPIYSSCNSQVIHTNKLNTTHQTHTHSHINTIQVKYWTIPQHQRKLRTILRRRKERLRLRFRKNDRTRILRIWTWLRNSCNHKSSRTLQMIKRKSSKSSPLPSFLERTPRHLLPPTLWKRTLQRFSRPVTDTDSTHGTHTYSHKISARSFHFTNSTRRMHLRQGVSWHKTEATSLETNISMRTIYVWFRRYGE